MISHMPCARISILLWAFLIAVGGLWTRGRLVADKWAADLVDDRYLVATNWMEGTICFLWEPLRSTNCTSRSPTLSWRRSVRVSSRVGILVPLMQTSLWSSAHMWGCGESTTAYPRRVGVK